MFVRAQAASNWTRVWGERRNSTKPRWPISIPLPSRRKEKAGGLTANDTGLNNTLDGRVALLGEQLAETSGGAARG